MAALMPHGGPATTTSPPDTAGGRHRGNRILTGAAVGALLGSSVGAGGALLLTAALGRAAASRDIVVELVLNVSFGGILAAIPGLFIGMTIVVRDTFRRCGL